MYQIKEIFKKLIHKENLTIKQSSEIFEKIINKNIDPIQISSLLTFLFLKGESFEEIIGAVNVLKKKAKKINLNNDLLDTCGTGGDNKGSFNFSTATAILLSACGVKVAKHGNRSITSKSGSSDVLSSLGININLEEKDQKKFFKRNGICFLFAPNYHPSLKNVMELRKSLPFKTIFNLIGPLLNPASIDYQLLGVGEYRNLKTHSKCISTLGIKSAWVVHNMDGYDELTTLSPNYVYKVKNNKVSKLTRITPEQAGLEYSKEVDLKGGAPEENAYLMHRLFEGETGAIRDNVLLNAGACLNIVNKVSSIKDGVILAAKHIDNFSGKNKLNELINFSKK